MRIIKNNTTQIKFLICMMIGLIASVVFFVCTKDVIRETMKRLMVEHIEEISNVNINHCEFLKDIIRIRVIQIGILVLIILDKRKRKWLYLCTAVLSFYFYLQILSCIYIYGIKGILLALVIGFPHYMIYLLVFIYVMYKNENFGKEYIQTINVRKGNKVVYVCSCLLEGLFVMASLILGILVECYRNPYMLKKIIVLIL